MDTDAAAFAEFYSSASDDCLRVVLATVRDRQTAEDLVAEAFARAWASWRKVSRHPAPRAWAAFGVKDKAGAATKEPLTLTTMMDIVYTSDNC